MSVCPRFALHGSADRLVPPAATELLRTHAGSPDLTVRAYGGLCHEPHNEPEKDEVLDGVGRLRAYLRQA